MNSWDNDSDRFDPVRLQRSLPMNDEEAAEVELLCLSATPGPLLTDDEAEEHGVLVATMADGRHIVSLSHERPFIEQEAADANIRLLCHARHLLLRLLRDRQQSRREREQLIEENRQLHDDLSKCERILAARPLESSSEGPPAQPR